MYAPRKEGGARISEFHTWAKCLDAASTSDVLYCRTLSTPRPRYKVNAVGTQQNAVSSRVPGAPRKKTKKEKDTVLISCPACLWKQQQRRNTNTTLFPNQNVTLK
jgi:hypothetical protein